MQRKESFLVRWSRRKLQRESVPAPEAAPAPGPVSNVRAGGAEAGLPSVESLNGLASDYRGFLQGEIDEKLRRAALKKLFSDPHFNAMDGLDTYIDDYSKSDPIPEALLRQMRQAEEYLQSDVPDETPNAAPAPSTDASAAALPSDAAELASDPAATASSEG